MGCSERVGDVEKGCRAELSADAGGIAELAPGTSGNRGESVSPSWSGAFRDSLTLQMAGSALSSQGEKCFSVTGCCVVTDSASTRKSSNCFMACGVPQMEMDFLSA